MPDRKRYTPKDDEFEMNPKDLSSIQFIAENIKSNDCVLFVGAGVNFGSDEQEAIYPKIARPPDGNTLRGILQKKLMNDPFKNEQNVSLSRVAQYFEVETDRLRLHRTLGDLIKVGKKPSPILLDLAQMPFSHIMTTNYDKLFELAFGVVGKSFQVGVYKRDRNNQTVNFPESEITQEKPFLYKVHGDIDEANSIVITDEDYIHFILRMSDKENYNPIPRSFNDAFVNKSILFIGYRLMDYNLRLLFKTIRWGKDEHLLPRNYSIDPDPDIVIKSVVVDYYKTNFVVLDSWKIIPYLYDEVFK